MYLSAVRSPRIFGSLVASLVVLSTSATLRAVDPVAPPIISYNPTITQVQGQLPISTAYPVEITMVVPSGNALSFPFPVALNATSTTRPDSVPLSAVADFVKFYAAPGDPVPITTMDFVGPGVPDSDLPGALVYSKTVHVRVNYPATAVAGTYAFKLLISSPSFPSGMTNQGSEINGSVTAPVAPPAKPPVVAISTPANGSTIEVPGGTTFPHLMDFSFTATVDAKDNNPRPITSVSADIDGVPISLDPTVLKPVPVTGLGTKTVAVNVSMWVSGVGAHIVTARATNDVGLPAQPDVHTFNVVIRKTPLTVTANNQTKIYGSVNPTLTYRLSGFLAGDNEANSVTGTPNVRTTATAFSPVLTSGTYPITPSLGGLASSKYDFVFVNGSLTVTPAELKFIATNATKELGRPNPNFGYVVTGLIAGDPNVPYTGDPALSCLTEILGSANTITISVGTLQSANYALKFVPGVLTVTSTPAPGSLTVSGIVFLDVDRNGTREPHEPGLEGIKVYLIGSGLPPAVSNASGGYSFPAVDGATYEVDAIEIPGLGQTTPVERPFTVSGVSISRPPIGFGFDYRALQNLNGAGFSHGYWKMNISKALENKTGGTQETKANLIAYTNTIGSSYLLPLFNGMTMPLAVTTMSGTDQLKLQLLASEYNLISGRFINNSPPLTTAFIYWGEVVANNPSNYTSAYRTFVKNWMDAFNNSHGGRVAGPASY